MISEREQAALFLNKEIVSKKEFDLIQKVIQFIEYSHKHGCLDCAACCDGHTIDNYCSSCGRIGDTKPDPPSLFPSLEEAKEQLLHKKVQD